jgi:hypothetical protein
MQPEIRHVTASRFNDYRWWEPQRLYADPRWFYGFASKGPRAATSARLDTVDRPLRGIVALCQRKRIRTLPSCSGHFPPERTLRALYRGIKRDSAWVQGHGLSLRCSENGSLRVYRNPSWKLPSFNEWAKPILKSNGAGRIGFVFSAGDSRIYRLIRRTQRIKRVKTYATRQDRAIVVTLTTAARTPKERNRLWRLVFSALLRATRTI